MNYNEALELLKKKGSQLVMAAGHGPHTTNIVDKTKGINKSMPHEMGRKLLSQEQFKFLYRECLFGIVQMRYEYGQTDSRSAASELLAMLRPY